MHSGDVDPARKAFGLRLAAARDAAGMTGTAVGKQLGYKSERKIVSQWETGHAVPDAMVLKQLCRLYNVSADSLIWGDDEQDRPDRPALDADLLQRLASATPEQRALVRNLVQTTLDSLKVATAGPADSSGKHRRAA